MTDESDTLIKNDVKSSAIVGVRTATQIVHNNSITINETDSFDDSKNTQINPILAVAVLESAAAQISPITTAEVLDSVPDSLVVNISTTVSIPTTSATDKENSKDINLKCEPASSINESQSNNIKIITATTTTPAAATTSLTTTTTTTTTATGTTVLIATSPPLLGNSAVVNRLKHETELSVIESQTNDTHSVPVPTLVMGTSGVVRVKGETGSPTIETHNNNIQSGNLQDTTIPLNLNHSNNVNSDSRGNAITNPGGRLQFYKDGKFILELARTREGERSVWVSVPRKTFWPPSVPSTNIVSCPKNESSTSLSFSDDNSSIQSSPWQRDHCWKQTSPRRNISKEMVMYFCRLKKFTLSHEGYKTALVKRRRPYDNSVCKTPFTLMKNGVHTAVNSANDHDAAVENNGETSDTHQVNSSSKPMEPAGGNCSYKKKSVKPRIELNTILQRLIDKLPTGLLYASKSSAPSGIINHFSSTPMRIAELQHHQQHVSPRKRILRELEKVSLEDSNNKRSRAKSNSSSIIAPTVSCITSQTAVGLSHGQPPSHQQNQLQSKESGTIGSGGNGSGGTLGIGSNSLQQVNNVSQPNRQVTNGTVNDSNVISPPSSTRLYSSYSIHSLLSNSNTSNDSKNDSASASGPYSKDSHPNNDPSYLRTMLSSPKSPENYSKLTRCSTSISSTTNSGHNNSAKKKSPTYSLIQDQYSHRRSPVQVGSETNALNYNQVRSPDMKLSPDSNYNRYKSYNNAIMPSASSGFHPYMSPSSSSAKYSPSNSSSLSSTAENYKLKSNCAPSSPNHHVRNSSRNSRSPSLSAFVNSPQHSSNKTQSLNATCGSTSNYTHHLRGTSPSDSLSSMSDRASREGTPKTVPKKNSGHRQQYPSPSSLSSSHFTNSVTSAESPHSIKSSAEQRRKNGDDGVRSPESSAYHATNDLDHSPMAAAAAVNAVLGSSPVIPTSPLYYMYPPHGSSSTHPPPSSYIPSMAYYHQVSSQYAAAVAALRHPYWMPYQTGVIPSPGPPSRLGPSILSYNGGSSGLGPPPPPSLTSAHLSVASTSPWTSLNQRTLSTEDPVSLVNIKDEPSSDVPLNLSKH